MYFWLFEKVAQVTHRTRCSGKKTKHENRNEVSKQSLMHWRQCLVEECVFLLRTRLIFYAWVERIYVTIKPKTHIYLNEKPNTMVQLCLELLWILDSTSTNKCLGLQMARMKWLQLEAIFFLSSLPDHGDFLLEISIEFFFFLVYYKHFHYGRGT